MRTLTTAVKRSSINIHTSGGTARAAAALGLDLGHLLPRRRNVEQLDALERPLLVLVLDLYSDVMTSGKLVNEHDVEKRNDATEGRELTFFCAFSMAGISFILVSIIFCLCRVM
jgi:hypothetical protein